MWGSCYGISDLKNDIFKTIGSPDVFMWGGDVVYSDFLGSIFMPENNGYLPMNEVKEIYKDAETQYPYYNEMKDKGTKVIGVWDDHDYGINDGG